MPGSETDLAIYYPGETRARHGRIRLHRQSVNKGASSVFTMEKNLLPIDGSKLKRFTGFEPKVHFEQALLRIIRWYRQHYHACWKLQSIHG